MGSLCTAGFNRISLKFVSTHDSERRNVSKIGAAIDR